MAAASGPESRREPLPLGSISLHPYWTFSVSSPSLERIQPLPFSLSLSWVGVKHGIYPALQFGERNLGIPPGPPDWIYIQSFKQLSASIPTHHPWCTAYLHSKCLMLNLSGIPCERTNNLSEWHKDYIKVKISDLHVKKEIFPELLSD